MNALERPQLRAAVEATVRARLRPGARVERVATSLSAYSSSFRIETVTAALEGGGRERFVLKDVSWETMLAGARALRPRDGHDPRREIDVYHRVLPFAPPGPPLHLGDFQDPQTGDQWLFLEEVPGLQLCHVGEIEAWEAVASWTGAFHRAGARPEVVAAADAVGLRRRGGPEYRRAGMRAWARIDRHGDARQRAQLAAVLARHPEVVDRLVGAPPTVVHGQLYPANVVVDRRGPGWRACVLDWETATVGAAALDLAALVEGEWDATSRRRLLAAYATGRGRPGSLDDLERDVTCARIQLCLDLISLPAAFDPPADHARDWPALAAALTEELA